jgi:glycosyltransferase involved in cell wall biosynthesis
MKSVSLVICCFNEEAVIPALFERIAALDASLPSYRLELVCVNDGSADGTLEALLAQRRARSRMVVLDLSRNFGKEAALSAGLAHASGDAVVPIDADLQDPPELIPQMLQKWEEGFEVVLARRSDRSTDSVSKRVAAGWFYRVHNAMSDIRIPAGVGDFRLLDRCVVDVLNSLPENRRFMKGLFAWAGFRTATVEYRREPRASGRSHFGGWRLWNLAVEGITSFSLMPLRVWSYVGALVATASLAYGAFILVRTLVYGRDWPGYASLIVAILFLGGLQLIGIGIIGEYLGRTYLEAKRRPAYVVRKVFGEEPPA